MLALGRHSMILSANMARKFNGFYGLTDWVGVDGPMCRSGGMGFFSDPNKSYQ